MTGHLLGGAGGMEAVATTLTIVNGIIPPTMNYHEVDDVDGMDLDYVPNEARKQEVRAAMSSNFGFGGHNAVIVIKKYKE
jgi:3-oxoacyl-[acyl-carrier-protein] synthase II